MLGENETRLKSQKSFRCDADIVFTEKVDKIVLNANDENANS